MLKKFFFSILAFLFLNLMSANAQLSATDKISSENYSADLLKELIVDSINVYRSAGGGDAVEMDDILSSAAGDQADYMTEKALVELEQPKAAKKTTGKRVRYYGGSSEGSEEVILYIPCAKSKEQYSYEKVTSDIMMKLMKNKKNTAILLNKIYKYAGVGATIDGTGKKLYISIVLGTEDAITQGK